MKQSPSPQENQQHSKSTEQKRAPWPFKTHNGKPLLPAKKFNPSEWPDAPF